jgi:hypothetical protein
LMSANWDPAKYADVGTEPNALNNGFARAP